MPGPTRKTLLGALVDVALTLGAACGAGQGNVGVRNAEGAGQRRGRCGNFL